MVDPEEYLCEDLSTNFEDIFFGRNHTEEVRTFCERFTEGYLSDVGGFCSSAGLGDAVTPEKIIVLSAWNDGGCEGNMEIKAVLQDSLSQDLSLPPSECLSGIVPICQEVTSGTGGPPFDPNVTGTPCDSAGSKEPIWLGLGVALVGYLFSALLF